MFAGAEGEGVIYDAFFLLYSSSWSVNVNICTSGHFLSVLTYLEFGGVHKSGVLPLKMKEPISFSICFNEEEYGEGANILICLSPTPCPCFVKKRKKKEKWHLLYAPKLEMLL